MGVLNFENRGGNGNGNGWNYAHPDKENFMTTIKGTVVEVKEVPKTKFNSTEIDRWDDGKAKLNICLTIQGQSGRELDWVFGPGGITKPTTAMAACRAALQAAGKPAESVAELGGLMIQVSTQQPPEGFSYGQGSPRPWSVQVLGPGNVPFRGVTEYTEEQVQTQQQPQPQLQQQLQQAPAPVAQPTPATQVMAQPVNTTVYDEDIPF